MIGAILGAVAAIASAAVSVAKVVGTIGLAIEGLKVVVKALVSLCKALGLIEEDKEPEELGDKAIQYEEATGKKPEDFDSYEEYLKEVEEFEVDPERSKQISEEAKQLKAAEISTAVLMEKFPDLKPETLETILTTKNLSPEKMAAYIGTMKDGTPETLTNIAGVLTNSEKNPDKREAGLYAMLSAEKAMDPTIDDKQAQNNVKETIRNAQKG